MKTLYKINIVDDDDYYYNSDVNATSIASHPYGVNGVYNNVDVVAHPKNFITNNVVIPYKKKFYEWVKQHPINKDDNPQRAQKVEGEIRTEQEKISESNEPKFVSAAKKITSPITTPGHKYFQYGTMAKVNSLIKKSTVAPEIDDILYPLKGLVDKPEEQFQKIKNNKDLVVTLPDDYKKYNCSDDQLKLIKDIAKVDHKIKALSKLMTDDVFDTKYYNGQKISVSKKISNLNASRKNVPDQDKDAYVNVWMEILTVNDKINDNKQGIEADNKNIEMKQKEINALNEKLKYCVKGKPDYIKLNSDISKLKSEIIQLNSDITMRKGKMSNLNGDKRRLLVELTKTGDYKIDAGIIKAKKIKGVNATNIDADVLYNITTNAQNDLKIHNSNLKIGKLDVGNIKRARNGEVDQILRSGMAQLSSEKFSLMKQLQTTILKPQYENTIDIKNSRVMNSILRIHKALKSMDNNQVSLKNSNELYDAVYNTPIEELRDNDMMRRLRFAINWWEKTTSSTKVSEE